MMTAVAIFSIIVDALVACMIAKRLVLITKSSLSLDGLKHRAVSLVSVYSTVLDPPSE